MGKKTAYRYTHIREAKYCSKSGCLRGNKITSLADCVRTAIGGCTDTAKMQPDQLLRAQPHQSSPFS